MKMVAALGDLNMRNVTANQHSLEFDEQQGIEDDNVTDSVDQGSADVSCSVSRSI